MELQPGTIFDDRYEIVKLIGEGGMGAIYQARETELGRTVALKLIHRELLTDNDSYTRFRQEGHVLSQLQHEGIVTSYRFRIWQEKTAYIAMELVEGLSMRAAIENQGHLSSIQSARLGKQICEAMAYAHQQNIVHRDLKPGNILLVGEPGAEQVRVIDFGLAKILAPTAMTQHLTQTGMLVGSVFYMSPEQFLGKTADSRTDVYSLGCVLYECLSGHPPFQADSSLILMSLHVSEPVPSLQTAKHKIDNVLVWDEVLHQALAKDPDQRYQSMSQFADDLRALLNGNYVMKYEPSELKAGTLRSRASYMIPAAILSMVAFAVLALVYVRHYSPSAASFSSAAHLLQPAESTSGSREPHVVMPDWIYAYRGRQPLIRRHQRIPLLQAWLRQHGASDLVGAATANFWLCMETADMVGDVFYSQSHSTLDYNIPSRRELPVTAEGTRTKALLQLKDSIKTMSLSRGSNKAQLLYYIAVLEMLDQTYDQREKSCRALLADKEWMPRFHREIKRELTRIYRRAGDFPSEEKVLRVDSAKELPRLLRLVECLACQGKDVEARELLQRVDRDLGNVYLTPGVRLQVHHMARLHIYYRMLQPARRAIDVCPRVKTETNLRLEDGGQTCHTDEHQLIKAQLLIAENKNSLAMRELQSIGFEDGLERRAMAPTSVMLSLHGGGSPDLFISKIPVQFKTSDVEWTTLLSERLRPIRPATSDRLDSGALKIVERHLSEGGSTGDQVRRVGARLLAAGRYKDLDALLQQAKACFERKQFHEALMVVALLKIRSHIAQGNLAEADVELQRILPTLSCDAKYSGGCTKLPGAPHPQPGPIESDLCQANGLG